MPPVSPVRPVSPDANDRQPTDNRPRREDRASTFDAALAQAVAEESAK